MSSNQERTRRLAPLGPHRLRLLSCLGGDMPSLPQYLALAPAEDVFGAFRAFVERMAQRSSGASDAMTRALVGAARLLVGDVAGARDVIEHLPAAPVRLDHGAGYCLLAPAQALKAALPLPASLRDSARWLAGSTEQAALRAWLERHGHALTWHEGRGVYELVDGAPPAPPEAAGG